MAIPNNDSFFFKFKKMQTQAKQCLRYSLISIFDVGYQRLVITW